ncbi:MAG: DUF4214 domain-containing protein [Pseudomonadota bacterium]
MTTMSFFRPTDMVTFYAGDDDVGEEQVLINTSSLIRLDSESGIVSSYEGSFTYPDDLPMGTTTRIYQTLNGELILDWTGLNADIRGILADDETVDTGGLIGEGDEGDFGFFVRLLSGNDTFNGSDGADRIVSFDGADTINGGAGFDQSVHFGTFRSYEVGVQGDGTVTVGQRGESVRDFLISVEQLIFDDQTYDIAAFSGISGISAEEIRLFVEMYIAYFDRAPDAEGLAYWGTRLNDGMTYAEIARSFFVQDETVARYPDPNDSAALVDSVYANVLEREADDLGRAFWIGELDNGNVTRGEFILAIIDGAKNFDDPDATPELIAQAAADVQTLTDKADIGIYYAAINGLGDPFGDAVTVMQGYDVEDREGSLAAAQTQVDGFAADNEAFTLQLVGLIEDPFATA